MALTVVQSGVGGTGNANLTFPSTSGTVALFSSSTGTATASAGSSNVYQNIISSITLPNKSLIVAYFKATTSGGNTATDATYSTYISTNTNTTGAVASYDGVSVYPKAGIGNIAQTLSYVNVSGSSQSIWLASYPYAGGGFNAPVYTVTYYIVSFA
jgi:hypothetical protein